MSALISACGGSSSNGKDGLAKAKFSQADAVKFAKCMREHGVKVEVSTNGGGVQMKVGGPLGSSGETHADAPAAGGKPALPPGIETAQRDCKKYAPNEGKAPKLSPAEEAKQREAALKFARCMRSHGVDVTDSSSGTIELPSGVNPENATFQDAQKDCQGEMGNLPMRISGGGPPGGGKSSSESVVGSGSGG